MVPAYEKYHFGSVAVQIPFASSKFHFGDGGIAVFLVGARINHPLGILALGAEEFVSYFSTMENSLEIEAKKYSILGASSRIANKERKTNNEILYIYYFWAVEGV